MALRGRWSNIFRLGIKELWSLWRDPAMLFLIVYTTTLAVYSAGMAQPETLYHVPIAIVDEDDSALSQRIATAFYAPQFTRPAMISMREVDPGLDAGRFTLVLHIPAHFQRDVLAGKVPVNLNFTIGADAMESAIQQCGIKTIVTARAFLSKAKLAERPDMIFVEELLAKQGKVAQALMYLASMLTPTSLLLRIAVPKGQSIDDLCTVMFSSGSTGEPKGVMLSQHNVISNLEAIAQILWLTKDDKFVGVLPFFHSFGFTGTLCLPLVIGNGAVYHANPLDAKTIGGLVKKYQATITTKDDRNNTKTFTDYCDASSNSEATTIFKARYPKATVSGVRETK